MGRNTTRTQNLTRVTTLNDGDVIVSGPASGDRAKGIIKSDLFAQITAEINHGIDSDDVANNSTVTGATVTAALNALGATSSIPIVLTDKADVLANGTLSVDEITLNVGYYYFEVIDLGTDVIILPGGAILEGSTATLSRITSASTKPTITARAGGFAACAIVGTGGARINNTGGGAAIRVQDTSTICAIRRMFTSVCGTALEINDSNVLLDSWTILGSVNGIVLTGTLSSGPIISNFNPIGLSGKGIYINGDIASSDLRINDAIINSVAGNGVEIAAGKTIPGMTFSGSSTSTGGNGMKIAGTVDGNLLIDDGAISSTASDGLDITGSLIDTMVFTASSALSIGAAAAGMKGNAQTDTSLQASGGNIVFSAIISTSNIQGVGGGSSPLSGITKKDLAYRFTQAGANITDSVNLGGFTLDAQATTTLSFQGENGTVTGFSDPGGGVNTTVLTAATPASGAPVEITNSTSYNGVFTAANVVGGVSFDIVRTFVANDGAALWESGWVKIFGSTTEIETIERFTSNAVDNELENLDAKTIAVTYSAEITGEKAGGTAEAFEFGLFCDKQDGNGFVKINGSVRQDMTNRQNSVALRIPTEAPEGAKFTLYTRNIDGVNDLICDALTVDIGLS